jgi:hypothetical protein
MGGYRGLALAVDAGSSAGARLARYRERLTPAQRAVFDSLHEEAEALGHLPLYAQDVMEPHGPWPDPFHMGADDE